MSADVCTVEVGPTTKARYCWCGFPCFSFFRIALEASRGLATRVSISGILFKVNAPSRLEIDRIHEFRDAVRHNVACQ